MTKKTPIEKILECYDRPEIEEGRRTLFKEAKRDFIQTAAQILLEDPTREAGDALGYALNKLLIKYDRFTGINCLYELMGELQGAITTWKEVGSFTAKGDFHNVKIN